MRPTLVLGGICHPEDLQCRSKSDNLGHVVPSHLALDHGAHWLDLGHSRGGLIGGSFRENSGPPVAVTMSAMFQTMSPYLQARSRYTPSFPCTRVKTLIPGVGGGVVLAMFTPWRCRLRTAGRWSCCVYFMVYMCQCFLRCGVGMSGWSSSTSGSSCRQFEALGHVNSRISCRCCYLLLAVSYFGDLVL
jgi:hypothetical protein